MWVIPKTSQFYRFVPQQAAKAFMKLIEKF